MATTTGGRVQRKTDTFVNQRIERDTEARIDYYAAHPEKIDERLRELDREWDIERMLEAGSSSLTLAGFLLAVLRGKKYLLLSIGVQSFFLQHAIDGWCPPLPVLRRLGFRTRNEIDFEYYALRALRGDFPEQVEASKNAKANKSTASKAAPKETAAKA